ncbi:MAG: type II toxin-antitoxin system VapC family toxin [Candidatus Firestonebacteria bacterium]
MKRTRIYVDTSVIGGCCDLEFKEWSEGLLSDFRMGIFSLVLSSLTDAEIKDAPDEVKKIYGEFRDCEHEFLDLNTEVIDLAESYLTHSILTQNYKNDAMHIALASVANIDILVSWNFQHVVNFNKIQQFNAVNLEKGYKIISIYSPREVTTYVSKSN